MQGHLILRPKPQPLELTEAEKEAKRAKEQAEYAAMLNADCWRRRELAFKGFFGSVNRALAKQSADDTVWSLSMLAVRPDCQGDQAMQSPSCSVIMLSTVTECSPQ